MLKIHTLTLGAYQTNTYIVHDSDSKTCVVIDPGYEPETILQTVAGLGLDLDAILLTHGHFDHVGAVEHIAESTGCQIFISRHDHSLPSNPIYAYFYPLTGRKIENISFPEDGQTLSFGDLTLQVIATPGHTCGSVCFLCGDTLFSGDTLFAGGCGRTDLPGGDYSVIRRSLARLAALDGDLQVCPGHGESTTLAYEKRYNPYM